MVDDSSAANPDRMAALSAKLEKESRFTRTLVVVCMVANLCVMFYMMHEMFTSVPMLVVTKYMESLQTIHSQWKSYDNVTKNAPGPAPVISK